MRVRLAIRKLLVQLTSYQGRRFFQSTKRSRSQLILSKALAKLRQSIKTIYLGRAYYAVSTYIVSILITNSIDRSFLAPIQFYGRRPCVSAVYYICITRIFSTTLARVFSRAISRQLPRSKQSFFPSFYSTIVVDSRKLSGSVPPIKQLLSAYTSPSAISGPISQRTLFSILSSPRAFPQGRPASITRISSLETIFSISILPLPCSSPMISLRSAYRGSRKNFSARIRAYFILSAVSFDLSFYRSARRLQLIYFPILFLLYLDSL